MKKYSFFYSLYRKLNPLPAVGALAIGNNSLRYVLLRGSGKMLTASLRLVPGIIEDGKIKDEGKFRAAIEKLHHQLFPSKRIAHIILSLSPELVYVQTFTLPFMLDANLSEAAELNLNIISPFERERMYASWQKTAEYNTTESNIDLLGAFAEASIVDQFMNILEEMQFTVTAVEFPALALTRLFSEADLAEKEKSYLAVYVSDDGIALMLLRNQSLHFHKFHSWKMLREEMGQVQISTNDVKTFLTREIQKVLNFHTSKWGGVADAILLMSEASTSEFKELLEVKFSLPVKIMGLRGFKDLSPAWFPALGSAIRGTISRSKDFFISLSNISVRDNYYQARLLGFIGFWRKMALTVILFVFLFFGSINVFLFQEKDRLNTENSLSANAEELAKVQLLQDQGEAFNKLSEFVRRADGMSVDFAPVLKNLFSLREEKISFDQIVIEGVSLFIKASAEKEADILAFKDRLSEETIFSNIDIPLVNIKTSPEGVLSFTLTADLVFSRTNEPQQ